MTRRLYVPVSRKKYHLWKPYRVYGKCKGSINAALVSLLLALSSCATPTLQQRQANWRRVMDVTRAECMVGQHADPAMPDDVREWCVRVVEP